MAYFLVALKAGPASDEEPHHADAHVEFIDSLIERRLSIEEAQAIAAEDPYSIHGVCETETVEWHLVGIDPDLIDPDLVG